MVKEERKLHILKMSLALCGVLEAEGSRWNSISEVHKMYCERVEDINLRTIRRYLKGLEYCGLVEERREIRNGNGNLITEYKWMGWLPPIC